MHDNSRSPHSPAFQLQRAEDPLASIVPQARRQVQMDKSLPHGAKLLFDYLTDCSLWPGHNVRPGVVRFSNKELAEKFNCGVTTIRNWKRGLIERGRVWTTEKWMKNCWPLTTYNITAIVGQQPLNFSNETDEGYLPADDDQHLSNRRRAKLVARDPLSGKWLPKPQNHSEPQFQAQPLNGEHLATENLPASRAMDCPPRGQPIARHAGNGLPAPQATNCPPRGQTVAAVAGNELPATRANGCPPRGQLVAHKEEAQSLSLELAEVPFKRSTGLNAQGAQPGEAGNGQGRAPVRLASRENLFLLDVRAVIEKWGGRKKAEFEMANSGGWWRTAYRADAELMQRVLAETLCAVKERRIDQTPGQYAVDFWKRCGGKVSPASERSRQSGKPVPA